MLNSLTVVLVLQEVPDMLACKSVDKSVYQFYCMCTGREHISSQLCMLYAVSGASCLLKANETVCVCYCATWQCRGTL